jgi:hypothetical protein
MTECNPTRRELRLMKIFGPVPDLPIKLPEGVVRYRLQSGEEEFALLFMRFTDRIEQWYVARRNSHLYPHTKKNEWKVTRRNETFSQ